MTTRMLRIAVAGAFALAVAGCGANEYLGKPKEPEPNIVPVNYKQEIIDTLQRTLGDPTNVRDAGITEPVLMPIGREPRYAVCVRENSRDSAKRYTGVTTHIAIFYAGRLNQLVAATKDQCVNAAYKPFPELEKLCFSKECA